MNKKILATACLLASVSAPANELDNLVNASSTIAGKLDLGIQYVGAATVMSATNVWHCRVWYTDRRSHFISRNRGLQ